LAIVLITAAVGLAVGVVAVGVVAVGVVTAGVVAVGVVAVGVVVACLPQLSRHILPKTIIVRIKNIVFLIIF
jgi:hypothetical protein